MYLKKIPLWIDELLICGFCYVSCQVCSWNWIRYNPFSAIKRSLFKMVEICYKYNQHKMTCNIFHYIEVITSSHRMGLVRLCAFLLILSSHFDLSVLCIARIFDDSDEDYTDSMSFRSILQAPVICSNGTYWDDSAGKCREIFYLFK